MGVNLSGLVEAKTLELTDLRGKSIAIDAYNTIYQFLSFIMLVVFHFAFFIKVTPGMFKRSF